MHICIGDVANREDRIKVEGSIYVILSCTMRSSDAKLAEFGSFTPFWGYFLLIFTGDRTKKSVSTVVAVVTTLSGSFL